MTSFATPEPIDPELEADIESAFLGHWGPDVMDIVRAGYQPGALADLARVIGIAER